MNSYLAKPFRKEELIREIGKVLHRNTKRKPGSEIIATGSNSKVKPEAMKIHSTAEIVRSISLTKLQDLYGGNRLKMQEYLQQFLEIVPERLQQLKQMVAENNREAIYQSAHRLKPQLGFWNGERRNVCQYH